MSRKFHILTIKDTQGKTKHGLKDVIMASTPASAAKKAAKDVCKKLNLSGACSFKVYLKEITPESNNKEFSYKVDRLKNEKQILRDGVLITYKFLYKTTSLQNSASKTRSKSHSRSRSHSSSCRSCSNYQ